MGSLTEGVLRQGATNRQQQLVPDSIFIIVIIITTTTTTIILDNPEPAGQYHPRELNSSFTGFPLSSSFFHFISSMH